MEKDETYYFRIEGSLSDQNCIILYNGAADIAKKESPIFQRSSWIKDIEGLVINIDDPTVRLRKDIVLGWGQGKINDYYSMNFNNILQKVLLALKKDKISRIHFGSSAGGYQAIIGASLDKGSRAVVCNPQIDWAYHFFETHVNKIREATFRGFKVNVSRSFKLCRLGYKTF